MLLRSIQLTNFKNYTNQTISPANGFTCFLGLNGMGKTNLLDAIYFLCTTKSKFSLLDKQLIKQDSDFYRVEGFFEKKNSSTKIVAKFRYSGKKIFEKDDIPYRKLAEHIGSFPVVFFTPDDTQLVGGGSEERRKFMDQTISQLDQLYLDHLITYEKILKQRNSLLKRMDLSDSEKLKLLDIYDEQLKIPAQYLHDKRGDFTDLFLNYFQKIYQSLSQTNEDPQIKYESPLQLREYCQLMESSRKKDLILQRTATGPHRDDLKLSLRGYPLKKFGSQGQLKTFVISLKLAQYEFLMSAHQEKPLLLLDDIFDKLDNKRVEHLISYLAEKEVGQVFITDTDEQRINSVLRFATQHSEKYEVLSGKATLIQ